MPDSKAAAASKDVKEEPKPKTEAEEKKTAEDAQQALLKKAFDAFDTEKKGWIDIQMVGTILDMLGQALPPSQIEEIIEEIDEDETGEMDFDMFCILAGKFLGEKPDEGGVLLHKELMEAFRLYDREANGYITTDVLREILEELDPDLSDDELDGIIDEIDADGSGTIDFEEFKAMMTGD